MLDSIAVIGSLDADRAYDPPLRDPQTGVRACRELGARLAAEGFGLTVYSSSPRFVEAAVVEGYAESGAARPQSIRLLAPMNAKHKQFAAMTDRPQLFQVINDPSTDWEVSFYRSLASVAGVLLIGGGRSTYIAGLIALSLRTPIVTLANFGGAAQPVWDSLDRIRNDATDEELQVMAGGWSDTSAATIVRSFKDQARRGAERAQSIRESSERATVSLVVAAILFVLGVALIPFLFAIAPKPWRNVAVLIAASLLVAPMGAIIRNVMGRGQHWLRTAVLGMVAGAVACLLFIVAQVATSPDALQGAGARTLLLFVVPISFVAGLTFDAVYNKLIAQDIVDVSAFRNHLEG
jgi:hypothetical protein